MESSAAVDLCFYLPSAAATHTTHYPLPTTSPISAMFQLFLASYQAILCSEERRAENENANANTNPNANCRP